MNKDMAQTIPPDQPCDEPAFGASDSFARQAWFEMLARHCYADSTILWPRAEQEGAAAVLPLIEDGRELNALANYYSFSYAPIFEGAPSPARQQALIGEIAARLRKSHSRVSFYPLLDPALAQTIRKAFASAGWIALLTDQNSNHYLDLNGRDFARYWADRPGQLRSSVKRKGKSKPYALSIEEQLTDRLWDEYMAVYNASWKNSEAYPEMVRALAEEAATRGALRMGFARAGDVAVAAQIWTIEDGIACIHKLAHDGAHDRNSPGTLLSHYMFEHVIGRDGIFRIDYGTGNNAYKRDWMEQVRPMQRLDCFNPRKASMWLPALRTRISQLVRRPG